MLMLSSDAPSEDPRGKAREGLCKLFFLHCGWSPAAGLRNPGGVQMLSMRMISLGCQVILDRHILTA